MSLPPEMLQRRYSAIELAYSERRWSEVESLSQSLLAELSPNPADPLQLRLVLLLGHTRLYGMVDPPGASHYYNSVLQHCEEPTLREIAQQGLEQCAQAIQATPASHTNPATPWLSSHDHAKPSGTSEEGEVSEKDGVSAAPSADATPWLLEQNNAEPEQPEPAQPEPAQPEPGQNHTLLEESLNQADVDLALNTQELASPSSGVPGAAASPNPREPASNALMPEVVEEPEQLAVAQADPRQRQELILEERPAPATDSTPTPQGPEELSVDQINALSRGLLRIRLP